MALIKKCTAMELYSHSKSGYPALTINSKVSMNNSLFQMFLFLPSCELLSKSVVPLQCSVHEQALADSWVQVGKEKTVQLCK